MRADIFIEIKSDNSIVGKVIKDNFYIGKIIIVPPGDSPVASDTREEAKRAYAKSLLEEIKEAVVFPKR